MRDAELNFSIVRSNPKADDGGRRVREGKTVSIRKRSNAKPPYVERYDGRVVYANSPPLASNPYNILDWRKRDAYPAPDDLTLSQWRWEFLRRSAHYRKFWTDVQKFIQDGWEPPEAELDYYVAGEYLTKLIDPRLKASEAPASLFSFKHHLVYELPTPEQIDDPELGTELDAPTNYSGVTFDEFMEIAERERCVLAMVRVDRPLKPQFAAIERAVSARHPKLSPRDQKVKAASERRLLPEKFPFYLRLLDAKDVSAPTKAKASWTTIEQHILAEPAPFRVTRDAVRRAHRQAKKTRARLIASPMID